MKSTTETTPSSSSSKRPLEESQHKPHCSSSSAKKPLIFLVDPSKPKVTLPALNDRMRNLFSDQNVLSTSCVSARLFACFTIVAEQLSPNDCRRSRRAQSSSAHPLWTLLESLVQVELTSEGRVPQKKTVHFTGFDCSSTLPPVDSILGSQLHWEESIAALETAVMEIHRFLGENENASVEELMASLDALVAFLRDLETTNGALMREECSRSMPVHWPPGRFKMAAQQYRLEFEKIKFLLAAHSNEQASVSRDPSTFTSVETQLAKFLGQAIRFYLRKFFNPAPWKGSTLPVAAASRRQSRVHELLEMKPIDGRVFTDTAVADGSISSVVSTALKCICAYFGLDLLSASEEFLADTPQAFCNSAASQRGLPTRTSPSPITEEDLNDVVADIHQANCFLHASHACRFLSELMKWPGVQEEINKVGGWALVEGYAKKIQHHELIQANSDDVHLILLSDVERLLEQTDRFYEASKEAIELCERALHALSLRFKCGAKNKSFKRKHPQIRIISETLEEVSRFEFPTISTP